MPRTPQSQGTCTGCKTVLDRMAMHRHLDQCEKTAGGGAPRAGATVGRLRIAIDTPDGSPYWIIVDAHPNATLKELDDFLRELWLECCGHLSAFYREDDTWFDVLNSPRVATCGYGGNS